MAAAGLAIAAAPVVSGVAPAAAAINRDERSARITFIDHTGAGVTCEVVNDSSRDTSTRWAEVSAQTPGPDECSTVFVALELSAKDENGVTHTASASGYSSLMTARLDHAASAVRSSVRVYFYACNPNASTTCELTVTAAPK